MPPIIESNIRTSDHYWTDWRSADSYFESLTRDLSIALALPLLSQLTQMIRRSNSTAVPIFFEFLRCTFRTPQRDKNQNIFPNLRMKRDLPTTKSERL